LAGHGFSLSTLAVSLACRCRLFVCGSAQLLLAADGVLPPPTPAFPVRRDRSNCPARSGEAVALLSAGRTLPRIFVGSRTSGSLQRYSRRVARRHRDPGRQSPRANACAIAAASPGSRLSGRPYRAAPPTTRVARAATPRAAKTNTAPFYFLLVELSEARPASAKRFDTLTVLVSPARCSR